MKDPDSSRKKLFMLNFIEKKMLFQLKRLLFSRKKSEFFLKKDQKARISIKSCDSMTVITPVARIATLKNNSFNFRGLSYINLNLAFVEDKNGNALIQHFPRLT